MSLEDDFAESESRPGGGGGLVGLLLAALICGATLALPCRADKCIDDDATPVQVLGWLAVHGYLNGYPWSKLFDNPPITGPRADVDSATYVAFYRMICERTAAWCPDAGTIAFPDWPADSQASFVSRGWRAGLFGQFAPRDSVAPPDTLPADPPAGDDLLAASDFEYIGAQRISGPVAWGGGNALGFFPPRGTLFISGTELTGRVLEIAPTTPSLSRNVASLPLATTVASASNPTGGLWNVSGETSRAGDLHPIQLDDGSWRIVFSFFDYYDRAYRCRPGFGWFKPDFTGAEGLWHFGAHWPSQQDSDELTYQGKITDHVVTVPKAFADAHFGGRRHLVGRTRGEYGEDVNCGPGANSVDFPGPSGAPAGTILGALPLMAYPTTGFVGTNTVPPRALPGYSLTDEYTDAFVVDNAYVAAGHECAYPSHYFDDDGSGGLADDPGVCNENKGYACGSLGQAAPGYEGVFLLFALEELARSARGEIRPWEVRPYARIVMSGNFLNAQCRASVGGVAFDGVARILYVVELGGDRVDPQNPKPLLHAWRIR